MAAKIGRLTEIESLDGARSILASEWALKFGRVLLSHRVSRLGRRFEIVVSGEQALLLLLLLLQFLVLIWAGDRRGGSWNSLLWLAGLRGL